jgi:tyrosinase
MMKRLNGLIAVLFGLSLVVALMLPGISATTSSALIVRKSVTSLTPTEKLAFVNALNTLKHTVLEGSTLSVYDQFVATHVAAMSVLSQQNFNSGQPIDAAHENAAFFPWHREYIRRFERALQWVDPTVTLPYWDWTDPQALEVLFQPDFMGTNGKGVSFPVPGIGEFEGGPIPNGNFSAEQGWTIVERLHISQVTQQSLGPALVRFIQVPPAQEYPLPGELDQRAIALDDYSLFRLAIEGFVAIDQTGTIIPGGFTHNYIHGFVGGVVIDPTTTPITFAPQGSLSNIPGSPNDPIFWLLHANADRIWAEWQDQGHRGPRFYPAKGQPYGHNLLDPMWPWDGGAFEPVATDLDTLLPLIPATAPNDIVRPVNVLNFRRLGYTYDTTETASANLAQRFSQLLLNPLTARVIRLASLPHS